MARAFAFAAGLGFGVIVGMGLHEALDRYVWDDQTGPEFKPAWEKRAPV